MITVTELEYYSKGGATTTAIDVPYDIRPREYLNFASEDYKDNKDSIRSRINALSNAKRALHRQIDLVTKIFGISKLTTKRYFDFPHKLEFCSKCGIVGPQILLKLNKQRNSVEHDYYFPSPSEVEDFIDITELFLAATENILENFPCETEFHSPEFDLFGMPKRGIGVVIEPYEGVVTIHINDFIAEPRANQEDAEIIHAEYRKISDSLRDGKQIPNITEEERLKYHRAIVHRKISTKTKFTINDSKDYFEWVSFVMNKKK